MDTVSSVSGVIALAALAAKTITQTVNTLKTLKHLPDDLRSVLGWLDRLSSVVKSIQLIPTDTPIEPPQLQLLAVHVRAASDAVARLSTKIKGEVASLDSSRGVKRQSKKVSIFLGTNGTEKQVQNVAHAVEALHLCHSEISRQLLSKTHSDVASVSRKLDESVLLGNDTKAKLEDISLQMRNFNPNRIGEEEIFRRISANIHDSSSRLERSVRDLDANITRRASVQASLQRSIKAALIADVKSAILPELKSYCDDMVLQGIKRPSALPTKNSMVNLSEDEMVTCVAEPQIIPSAPVDASSEGLGRRSPSDDGRCIGMAEAEEPSIPNNSPTTKTLGTPLRSMQTAWTPLYKDQVTGYQTDIILNCKRRVSWLGSLAIVVHRRTIVTDYLIYRFIVLEVSIAPNPRLLTRGISITLCWDAEKGQCNSLTNIRLFLPRILQGDDPLLELLRSGATNHFIRLFQIGGYSAQDEIYDECGGNSIKLIDEAFCSIVTGYHICIFLLQQGAKLSLGHWEGRIGYYLCTESDKALQITRLMMANESGPEFIPALPPIAFELIFNAISAHPNSVPDWVIHSNHRWAQKLQLCPVEGVLSLYGLTDFYDYNYDVDRDASMWDSIMRRSQVEVGWEDCWGGTCWSDLLGYCRHAYEELSINPVLERLLETRLKGLFRMQADPCKTNAGGLTPTTQAFTAYNRGWGSNLKLGAIIGPFWISALLASNVDVTAVARHSFRLCRDNDALLKLLNSGCSLEDKNCWCGYDECQQSPFGSIEELQKFLLDAFEKCGIHPDESWWVEKEEEPNEQNISATAVDFIPQTMYDAGKQDMEVKRRKGRNVEEE